MSAVLPPEVVDALVAERAAILAFARLFVMQLHGLVAAGKLSAAEATSLGQRIRAFADAIAQGLHVEHDPVELRRAMKIMMAEARDG